jgi:uncharacterized membrane protein YbhN (UPF0104 family)
MWRKYIRPLLAVIILITTISVFVHYLITNASVRHQLSRLSIGEIVIILLLYIGTMFALALVNISTLRLCKIKASRSESILITAYTAVVNFFGPLQSGPAIRAIYLKKRYNLNLKKYTLATFVYYFFWAAYSGIFLLSGLLKFWLVPLVLIGLVVLYFTSKHPKIKPRLAELDLKAWYYLAFSTFLQITLIAVIYFIELHSVAPATKFTQAIIYTGAANFALFVSITPGAIGFRETFLIFSKHLHHISNSTIVAANVVDRSVYLILLVLLALVIVLTHTAQHLGLKTKNES